MGGYVNFVYRGESTHKHLLTTGAVPELLSAGLYRGEPSAIDALQAAACEDDDGFEAANRLAPVHYGLIVVDSRTRTVFDLQCAFRINMISVTTPYRAWNNIPRLAGLGWLDHWIYDLDSERPLRPLPLDFTFQGNWLHRLDPLVEAIQAGDREQRGSRGGDLVVGQCRVPALKVTPPGWAFRQYDCLESAAMRDELIAAGFSFEEGEPEHWTAFAQRQIELERVAEQ